MNPRYLLDTHILVRWLFEPRRLTREQARLLRDADHRREQLAISAVSLIEIAMVFGQGARRSDVAASTIFDALATNPSARLMPITLEIAAEIAALGNSLPDLMDRAIVATARVERLILVTADQRIIDSKLAPVAV